MPSPANPANAPTTNTPTNNDIIDNPITTVGQVTDVNRVPQTTAKHVNKFPAEVWLMVDDQFDKKSDTFRLSRVNKFFLNLFIFSRAKYEAEMAVANIKRSAPSMLYIALKQGQPLANIQQIIAGYMAGCTTPEFCLNETHLTHAWSPPLFLAVRMNRLDVVDLLLSSGVRLNLKWCAHGEGPCDVKAHIECRCGGSKDCKNALDIAREAKYPKIVKYLQLQGIEDLGRDEQIPDWMASFQNETYSVCKDWWPSF
ncbi:hypothetical protein F4803DRAFT_517270 [Xylaria telfairii]|nr:hypothetical protein F4803DRAFT_517270 [Xylaria telfairii]